ncbi:hypothetical protein SZN_31704 [Streptomyces zinciresistens K42]|uniref:Uncharacterized protein n=1 Tax=Streptomyces zinciresistens K42 TaxID=700597 RepID=G2GLE5_9ACTN|nr:hypothetical protein [Streptomyces zinciresistens]EGX55667.1 hypothetical protein SZN_31704 [Streptomyces zinciresistens K42]
MSQVRTRAPDLPGPLRLVGAGLRHVPGAGQVARAADGALDRIAAVSPRGRRMAVYAGAGVLGAAGLVEWPVALTGAAVAWLTQPGRRDEAPAAQDRPGGARREERAAAPESPETSGRSGPAPAEHRGPGDRLAPSRFRQDRSATPVHTPVHEEPAKVGDAATASALKRVARAADHHDGPSPRTGPRR